MVQCESFQSADGRKQQFVFCVVQLRKRFRPKPFRVSEEPEPDVGVQQQLKSRRASHSSSSFAGEMISPRISIESFMEPIQAARSTTGAGGMTSATGFPWRVMRRGFLVLLTCSSNAKHLALNMEIGTSSLCERPSQNYRPWSN